MSISLTYWVTCDAPDAGDPDLYCGAEFQHSAENVAGDAAGLQRQLTARGWTHKRGKFTCPLHDRAAGVPQEGTDQ